MQAANDVGTRSVYDAVSAQAERLARKAAEQETERLRKEAEEKVATIPADSEPGAQIAATPERTKISEVHIVTWSDGQADVNLPTNPVQFADLIKIQVQLLLEHAGQTAAKNVIKAMQEKAPRDHFVQRLITGVRKALNV